MEERIETVISNQPEIIYATFWERFFALLIDSLVLMPIIIMAVINEITWKDLIIFLILFLITWTYKSFCEYKYGATIGKMVLKLIVVNKYFQKATFKEILLRNIFFIIGDLVSAIAILYIFNSPEFQNATTLKEYFSIPVGREFRSGHSLFDIILYSIEIILLLNDKQRRALHDRIGNTYVIKKTKEITATNIK